ncbi:MAG: hypothetical protein NDI61_02945 [Bdellovibrionaceae bacterium]|nr:hypothetical protein [Pseudobdellovibrionaceae bacterium]
MKRFLITGLALLAMASQSARAEGNSCLLVDQQEYRDLSQAIDVLGHALNAVPGCAASQDFKGVYAAQEQLRASALQLKQFWQDPALAASDASAFSTQLSTALTSMNSITDSIANTALAKTECGQRMLSSGKVLLAVSDVVTSLAPLAVLAGTMTASLSIAVPYVLGVAGVSSVFKILATLHDSKALDMGNYEHRQLVLRSTCEYSKVSQRLKYLMLMQSGHVAGLQSELDARARQLEASLKGRPQLQKMAREYKERVAALEAESKILRKNRENFFKLEASFNKFGNERELQCSFGQVLASKSTLPFGLTQQLDSLRKKFPDESDSIEIETIANAHVNVERRVRAQLTQGAASVQGEACANLTASWLRSSGQMLWAMDRILQNREGGVRTMLKNEPEYREWSRTVANIESERVLLTKVIAFMQVRSEPGSAITRSELSQRERDIRVVLFGTRGLKIPLISQKSLVGEWLNHLLVLYKGAISSFDGGYRRLDSDVVAPMIAANPARYQNSSLLDLSELKLLTLENFPKGSRPWKNACRRLDDVYLDWLRAQDHLDATQVFCQAIDDMIGEDVESIIIETCRGGLDLRSSRSSQSRIEAMKRNADNTRRPVQAALIQAKRLEMECAITAPAQ